VSVEGLTPGGNVVVFGVARVAKKYYSEVVPRVGVVPDSDGDGIVTLDYPEGVPPRAIWTFVDLVTGRRAVLPSAGYENVAMPFLPDGFKKANNGQLKKLELEMADIHLLLVRPGEGAWSIAFSANSGLDENQGTGEKARLDISRLLPVAGTPAAPEHFRKGDVVVAIDSRWMKYFAVEVGE
jgi:hypothetical protein